MLSFVGASALSSCGGERNFSPEDGWKGGGASAGGNEPSAETGGQASASGGAAGGNMPAEGGSGGEMSSGGSSGGNTGVDPRTGDGDCIERTTRSCGASPLDLMGSCATATAVCQDGKWEGCPEPKDADSCNPGNDDNCNGIPNEGCDCTEGLMQACGHEAVGICKKGTSTCQDQEWGACQGNIDPGDRDCSSADDNDCDGLPDDTIDDACSCEVGSTQACDEWT